MGGWLRSRVGKSVAAGTLAVVGAGGLTYAIAGPLTGSNVSTVSGSANFQASGAGAGAANCAGAIAGAAAGAVPSASGVAVAPAAACGRGRGGMLRRLLARSAHASLVVRDRSGQWVTVDVDRGTVKSISSTSITLLRPDGVTVTAVLSSSTKFLRQPESSVVAGDRAVVLQVGGTARYVLVGKPAGANAGNGAGSAKKASISVA